MKEEVKIALKIIKEIKDKNEFEKLKKKGYRVRKSKQTKKLDRRRIRKRN